LLSKCTRVYFRVLGGVRRIFLKKPPTSFLLVSILLFYVVSTSHSSPPLDLIKFRSPHPPLNFLLRNLQTRFVGLEFKRACSFNLNLRGRFLSMLSLDKLLACFNCRIHCIQWESGTVAKKRHFCAVLPTCLFWYRTSFLRLDCTPQSHKKTLNNKKLDREVAKPPRSLV